MAQLFSLLGITSYFCPCYVFGKNAEAVGDNCCLCGISYFIAPVNIYTRLLVRGKIRDKAGVEVIRTHNAQVTRGSGDT